MKASILKQNSDIFKAIGHVKRLEIVCLLQGHSLTVNQIVQMTGLRQSAVSQHLIILNAVKLTLTQKIGKEMYYSLDRQAVQSISNFLEILTKYRPQEDSEPTVIDSICHMHLTPSVASYTSEYDGVRQYFCGKGCLNEFNRTHKGAK